MGWDGDGDGMRRDETKQDAMGWRWHKVAGAYVEQCLALPGPTVSPTVSSESVKEEDVGGQCGGDMSDR